METPQITCYQILKRKRVEKEIGTACAIGLVIAGFFLIGAGLSLLKIVWEVIKEWYCTYDLTNCL